MSEPVVIALIVATPATIAALAAVVAAWRTGLKLDEVHVSLNKRLSELVERTAESSRLSGMEEERDRVAERESRPDSGYT